MSVEFLEAGTEALERLAIDYGLEPDQVLGAQVEDRSIYFSVLCRDAAGRNWVDPDTDRLAEHVVTHRRRSP